MHTFTAKLLKDEVLSKFVFHFDITHHKRPNKIHPYGYAFSPARNF